MKITEHTPLKPAGSASIKKRANVTGSAFETYLDASSAESVSETGSGTPVAVTSLDTMLSIQQLTEEEARRKKVVGKAHEALNQLEKLRHSLLMGQIPAYVLRNLSNILAEHRERLVDPRLNEVIDDIELRAAVELAKLEMAQARH